MLTSIGIKPKCQLMVGKAYGEISKEKKADKGRKDMKTINWPFGLVPFDVNIRIVLL